MNRTRQHIRAVSQRTILFDMTVHNNVAMGLAGPDSKRRPQDVVHRSQYPFKWSYCRDRGRFSCADCGRGCVNRRRLMRRDRYINDTRQPTSSSIWLSRWLRSQHILEIEVERILAPTSMRTLHVKRRFTALRASARTTRKPSASSRVQNNSRAAPLSTRCHLM